MALVGRKVKPGGRLPSSLPRSNDSSYHDVKIDNLVSASGHIYTTPIVTSKVAFHLLNLTSSAGMLVKYEFSLYEHGWQSYMLVYGMLGFILTSILMGVLWKIIDIVALDESKRFDDVYQHYNYYSSFCDTKEVECCPNQEEPLLCYYYPHDISLSNSPNISTPECLCQVNNRQVYFEPPSTDSTSAVIDGGDDGDEVNEQPFENNNKVATSSSFQWLSAVSCDIRHSQSFDADRSPSFGKGELASIQQRESSPLIDSTRVAPIYGSLSNND